MRLPGKVKVYESKAWLSRQTITLGKTPETIAKEQNVSVSTIYRYLEKFGLK